MLIFPRPILALLLVLSLSAAGPAAVFAAAPAPAGEFVEGVEDLPLMPGLTRIASEPLVFDKPDGRIVQATATGAVDGAAVERFYQTTLPQLGWKPAGNRAWARGRETLTLDVERNAGTTRVQFTIAPKLRAGERE
jgi:hypothetical protein